MVSRPALQAQNSFQGDAMRTRRAHTSALDGLRGVAALFVFFFHILFSYTPLVEYGYGANEMNRSLMQLPFFSLWHRGHSMVAVFFVVGGYVMAIKPLSLMHARQPSEAAVSLVSSVFRRGIRLYLPAVVATFMTMLTVHLGMWEYPRHFINEGKTFIYYADMHLPRLSGLGLQFWDWLRATANLTDFFNYYNKNGFLLPYYNPYDPHLWTVPFEYRSSLIVSVTLLAFTKCRTLARLFLTCCVIIFCGCWDRWELVCFLSGMLLCDLDICIQAFKRGHARLTTIPEEDEEKLPTSWHPSRSRSPSPSRALFAWADGSKRWLGLFGIGLYLLSTPNLSINTTPGYASLYQLTPIFYTDKKRFLQSAGAICTTWAITNSPVLQEPFNTPFAQYLGKISYSLYIVHGPLIHVVGYSVTPNIWANVTGMEGWRWSLGLGLGSIILAGFVAVTADLFWKHVDQRAVRLARWAEGVCFYGEDE